MATDDLFLFHSARRLQDFPRDDDNYDVARYRAATTPARTSTVSQQSAGRLMRDLTRKTSC